MDFSRSELSRLADSVVSQTAQSIVTEANKNLKLLSDYGVTADSVKKLQQKIDEYSALMVAPKVATVAKNDAKKRIIILVEKIDVLLKERIDPMIETFSESNPAFYDQYKTARKIDDLGTRHKKPVA
jgi:cellobiose-specific phosphotransferase system component IIB